MDDKPKYWKKSIEYQLDKDFFRCNTKRQSTAEQKW